MINADLQKECKLKLCCNTIFDPLDWKIQKFDNYVGKNVKKQVLSYTACGSK